ncbi:MAG: ABC transporter ATP-binding protein [Synergistaceae bacterium]|jgi:ABC-type glutathione transport system ATPase component|nr:ABC transporter ATP-binding protein [Synergistaceae bacterium]
MTAGGPRPAEVSGIELQELSVTYRGARGDIRAVKGCSFSIPRGGITGLVGESGSGKTSALMAIPALLPPGAVVGGRILLDGNDITKLGEEDMNKLRWRRVALVPQGAMNSFTPHLTIERHITEVLDCHLKMSRGDARARASELMETVGLERGILTRYAHELSGGQKQRAALAAALACEPDFLLADEPTTALDVITQKEVLDTIASLARKRGMGILLVTHDLPLALGICGTLIVMRDGSIVEYGRSRKLVAAPEQPYTRALIGAIRDMEGESA